jgi:hypothetical protein
MGDRNECSDETITHEGKHPPVKRATNEETVFVAKTAFVALMVIAMMYFWPTTMLLLMLPSTLFMTAFPGVITWSKVNWVTRLLGVKSMPIGMEFAKWQVVAMRLVNTVWWVFLICLTVWALRRLYKGQD